MKEVADIIEWGQGYDDTIIEVIKAFKKFRDGYYGLINYGEWWEVFNQDYDFGKQMKTEWEKMDGDDMMLSIERMACYIMGYYSRFDEFADGVIEAYENGHGLRHRDREDKKAVQNDK